MQQRNKPEWKPIKLYRRLTLLIVFCMFAILTLVYIVFVSINPTNPSSWLEKVHMFILALYPSIFIIPFTFFFSLWIFPPIRAAEQEANEERILEKIKETLVPELRTAVINAQRVSDSIKLMGIVEVNARVDYDILKNRIAQSKERIYLSDNWFFSHNINDFEEAFQQAALKNVPMRILMLNPQSPAAKLRSLDIYNDEIHMETKTQRTTEALRRFKKKFGMRNLEVKYHSLLPSVQIFLCDNQATVGFYFHGMDSQVKNEKNDYTYLGKQIESEFQSMWDSDSATVVKLDPSEQTTVKANIS